MEWREVALRGVEWKWRGSRLTHAGWWEEARTESRETLASSFVRTRRQYLPEDMAMPLPLRVAMYIDGTCGPPIDCHGARSEVEEPSLQKSWCAISGFVTTQT